MIARDAFLLILEFAVLAGVVLALFRMRQRIGITPLYVTLGVFQPLQVILAATMYVQVWPGVIVSPGSLMFTVSLLVMFVVYVREDALEARRFIYCILGANVLMTGLLVAVGARLAAPGVINLLDVSPRLFNQGARVTGVGTLVLVADVLLMIGIYAVIRRLLPHAAPARAWLTLVSVMVFDGVAFTLGAFAGRPDLQALLGSAVAVKIIVGTLAAIAGVIYLKFVEPPGPTPALPDLALRDIFYSLSYRDRFELQANRTAAVEAELGTVFQRIGDGVVAIGLDGRYTFANDLACALMERPRERVVGALAREIYGETAPALDHGIYTALKTQKPQLVDEFYAPQGRQFESRIYPSPEGVTIYFSDVTERNRQEEERRKRASTDELTGLLNRRALRDRVDALIRQRTHDRRVGLIVLNLDSLRHINNSFGYEVGDDILQQATARLVPAVRERFSIARTGGDEFALAGEIDDLDSFAAFADELVSGFRLPFHVGAEPVFMTCSAAVVMEPEAGNDAAALLRSADLTLNVAKQRGGNQAVRFSPEPARRLGQRMAMTTALRAAAETPQVDLEFQPVIDARSGAMVSAEALMRWNSPRFGRVTPVEFIPVAEDTGLISDLGYLAIRRALYYRKEWQTQGLAAVPVAVNVSPVQFRSARFMGDVVRALEETASDATGLKLEITESAFIDDLPAAVDILERLRAMGIGLSLDDFGTGYSSLSLLRHLPLDELKIDRSFVADAAQSDSAAILCRSVVALSHELGLRVVAEGVETPAQVKFLQEIGCDLLQGFHYSHPMAPGDFAKRFLAPANPGA